MHEHQCTAFKDLLHGLTLEEHEIYLWLREIKTLVARVYKALRVRDQMELIAYYGALGKEVLPEIPKAPPEGLTGALAQYSENRDYSILER